MPSEPKTQVAFRLPDRLLARIDLRLEDDRLPLSGRIDQDDAEPFSIWTGSSRTSIVSAISPRFRA
jgi:hypothetical protein